MLFSRQTWSLLRPYITVSDAELADLASVGVYVAGSLDPAIRSRHDVYDLLVDDTTKTVIVAEHAKGERSGYAVLIAIVSKSLRSRVDSDCNRIMEEYVS
jgi:hypothetical protein